MLLVLGELDATALSPSERDALLDRLRESYEAEDPGLHAAAEWALRQWKQDPWLTQSQQKQADSHRGSDPQAMIARANRGKARPQWYVNAQGQTMVVVPGPVEFDMGSPWSETGRLVDETLHRRSIGHSYALAAQLVTVAQFRRFRPDFITATTIAPDADCPVVVVSWYQAAEYCNWLSRQEGLAESECCYQPNAGGQFAKGMKTVPGFLDCVGYRLPTEAEWECACRAGRATARYFGQSEDLLPKFAWYATNAHERSWPVGMLKPNDLGLFDMYGNAWQWCQDAYAPYPPVYGGRAAAEGNGSGPMLETTTCVLRGGGFYATPRNLRSARRNFNHPANIGYANGFRVARTFK